MVSGRCALRLASLWYVFTLFNTPLAPAQQSKSPRYLTSFPQFTIVECEGAACSPGGPGSPIWTFGGPTGTALFGTGRQQMTIEHLDQDSIVVRRLDVVGPVRGLTALYLGKIQGQRIVGSVIYYAVGHENAPRTDAWYGIIGGSIDGARRALVSSGAETPSIPFTVRECEGNRCKNPGTPFSIVWAFAGREGRGWLGDNERPVILEHLDGRMLLVRRLDGDALGGLTALYMGEINGRDITGCVLYYDKSHPTIPRTDTWFGTIQSGGSSPATIAAQGQSATVPARPDASSVDQASNAMTPGPYPQVSAPKEYPPPPSSIPASIGNRHTTINLNGDWEGYYTSPAVPTAIRIRHNGLHIEADLLHENLTDTGIKFFEGNFDPRSSIAQVQVLGLNAMAAWLDAASGGSYHTDVFGTIDLDHVAIDNHPPFQRISLPSYGDIPCSSANEKGVKAHWAYMRAVVAQQAKDLPSAVCWLYVASVQGDATAQFYLADFLLEGIATQKNGDQAIQWAFKSAQNGSDDGAFLLAFMYEKGNAVPIDPVKARHWKNLGFELQNQKRKQAEADNQQEQQQEEGRLEFKAMAAAGAAFFAYLASITNLCDLDNPKYDAADRQWMLDEVQRRGEHCEEGNTEPVPNLGPR
jgi:hypothetical protein